MVKRLFAAVPVEASEALRERVRELQCELQGERIRWDRLQHPHVTLWFFGATGEERIPELERALARAAGEVPAFTMKIGGLGAFGGARHPRVIWLGVETGPELQHLFDALAAGLGVAGWKPEARKFAPHLTLGRMEGLRDAQRFKEMMARHGGKVVPGQPVRELILFESLLGRGGAEHVPLARWPLSGANEDNLKFEI
jgi:RNA 2',3'-cyclic 3'-phosphodiesterase